MSRLLTFVGMTVGGYVGWWGGEYFGCELLAVADAFVLAAFTILGAAKALTFDAGGVNAVVLGVMTGVAGGILRDVLVGEIPLVFRQETYFYATAAFAGATVFIVLERWLPENSGGGLVLCRLDLLDLRDDKLPLVYPKVAVAAAFLFRAQETAHCGNVVPVTNGVGKIRQIDDRREPPRFLLAHRTKLALLEVQTHGTRLGDFCVTNIK